MVEGHQGCRRFCFKLILEHQMWWGFAIGGSLARGLRTQLPFLRNDAT
jgi:hypothetical protein